LPDVEEARDIGPSIAIGIVLAQGAVIAAQSPTSQAPLASSFEALKEYLLS